LDLWIIDTKGGSPKQLTINSGSNMHPSVSPDGRTVVFASNRQVSFNLWKMDIDGSNPKQLTRGSGEAFPQYSPDGEWVVYQQGYGTVKATVWKTPIDGSNPVQLTEKYSIQPVISPDQKLVAYYQMDPQTNRWGVEVIPFEGGRSVKGLNIRPTVGARVIQWTPDGKALAYIQNRGGVSNIWYQLLSGGPPRQLTEFDADRIFFFDWSRGGKQLAFARGIETNDVVLISNFR
jgi:TolB protein